MNQELKTQIAAWRHYLHQHPETAFEENGTSDFIAEQLVKMGLDVQRNIGRTGIVASLKAGEGSGVIGLRADMDAIELQEAGEHPYTSIYPGKMHACGHDGHTATLLGAAKLLSERRDFNGTVRFIFQPAEEPGTGALAMLEDRIFERFPVDELYGLHNSPYIPEGHIHTQVGGAAASEDDFVIRIKGAGGHSSSPHTGHDPLVIAAEIIMALQTIVSRNVNPLESAVVSFTHIETDGLRNAIPSNVVIYGDTRSYSPEIQKLLENRMRTICEHICSMNGAGLEFEYTHEFVPLINSRECVEAVGKAARSLVDESRIDLNAEPVMASEDFARLMQARPGCYIQLGGGREMPDKSCPGLHNASFDYNDGILELGAQLFAEIVRTRLPM